MLFDKQRLYTVSRERVLTSAMRAIWEEFGIGVAVVDAEGICEYMNPIQRRVDGFNKINVTGRHITSLYEPYELEVIPTVECLRKGEPILKKAYWYKTTNQYLASTVTDFFPLFDHGKKDGVIAFTIWTGTIAQLEAGRRPPGGALSKAKTSAFYTFESIVGKDHALCEVIREAQNAARTSSSVMVWGESGTGKELFAQAIHAAGPRSDKPFIPVNCAAIPENLLEGILFGTVKGAYTDAADKPGLFEEAHGGALLFDELNSMPLGLQAKLLRVIQEKRVRRLGSHTEIPVDVRIISILNEDPLKAIERGILRRDLYYRLAVVGIGVPPLRARKEDISLLARTAIRRSEFSQSLEQVEISPEVLSLFHDYDWPGNVRELLHVLEGSLAQLGDLPSIEVQCLPRHFRNALRESGLDHGDWKRDLPETRYKHSDPPTSPEAVYFDYQGIKRNDLIPLKNCLRDYEARCIRNVLRTTGGNVAKAARIMALTAAGLHYRMKVLGIDANEE